MLSPLTGYDGSLRSMSPARRLRLVISMTNGHELLWTTCLRGKGVGGAPISPDPLAFEVKLDLLRVVQLLTSPGVEVAPEHPCEIACSDALCHWGTLQHLTLCLGRIHVEPFGIHGPLE